jgi:hypothetical protein
VPNTAPAAGRGPIAALREWAAKARGTTRWKRRNAELTEELRVHLELAPAWRAAHVDPNVALRCD